MAYYDCCGSPEYQVMSIFTSSFAAIVPRITGTLSVVSASLTIYVILRSRTKLSSIYHRIMFGMSVADIMGSIAMGLTTLPMPTHLPREDEFKEYIFAGTRLGNTQTCDAQAFFFLFGIVTMYGYNATLCLYYACAIAFRMKEKVIAKYVEIFIHLGPITVALGTSLSQLLSGGYNPSPWQAWCDAAPYPYNCADHDYEHLDCIRGQKPKTSAHAVWIFFITVAAFIVITCLSLVTFAIHRASRELKRAILINQQLHSSRSDTAKRAKALERVKESNQNSKIVMIQSFAYISAFVWTLLFPVLRIVMEPNPLWIDKAMLIFMPAQGFFNFLIFLWQKVYSYRRVNPNSSRREALHQIFCQANIEEPVLISRLSMVQRPEEPGGSQIDIIMDNEDEDNVKDSIEDPAMIRSTQHTSTETEAIDKNDYQASRQNPPPTSLYYFGDEVEIDGVISSEGTLSGFTNLSWFAGRSENNAGSSCALFANEVPRDKSEVVNLNKS